MHVHVCSGVCVRAHVSMHVCVKVCMPISVHDCERQRKVLIITLGDTMDLL